MQNEEDTCEVVINPLTKRRIKVGGAIWHKLVKQGILPYREQDDDHFIEKRLKRMYRRITPVSNDQIPDDIQYETVPASKYNMKGGNFGKKKQDDDYNLFLKWKNRHPTKTIPRKVRLPKARSTKEPKVRKNTRQLTCSTDRRSSSMIDLDSDYTLFHGPSVSDYDPSEDFQGLSLDSEGFNQSDNLTNNLTDNYTLQQQSSDSESQLEDSCTEYGHYDQQSGTGSTSAQDQTEYEYY